MDIETKLERLAYMVRVVGLVWAGFFGVLATWVGFKVPHDQIPLLLFALIGAAGYGIGVTVASMLNAAAAKLEDRIWLNEVEIHPLDGEHEEPGTESRRAGAQEPGTESRRAGAQDPGIESGPAVAQQQGTKSRRAAAQVPGTEGRRTGAQMEYD